MKWLVFIVALLASYPAGLWLRRRPAFRLHAWTLVGYLPFYSALDMALVFFGQRPGDTNGIEVALLDWLALVLLLATRGPARPLPYRFALGAYLLVALVSVTQAQWTLGALAYVWKLCRMYLMFAVICRAGDDVRVPAALLDGMKLGIVYEGLLALWQHYGLGLHQVTGSFVHQNTLGILLNLVAMVSVALILAGPATLLTTVAPLAALIAGLFTVSRGTILFFGAGSALVYLASVHRGGSRRKGKLGVLALALALLVAPVALEALGTRSAEGKAYSLEIRETYDRAASMMVQEHPLGIGPNNFTVMMLAGGYGDRAGVDWSQRLAIVHNVYWLTAAEMGYAGVAALVLLFLAPLYSAFRYGLQARPDRRCDVLLGLGAGLATFYAHSFFEWTWRITSVSYVYWMTAAVAATLARQLRDSEPVRATAAQARRPPGVSAARDRGGVPAWGHPATARHGHATALARPAVTG